MLDTVFAFSSSPFVISIYYHLSNTLFRHFLFFLFCLACCWCCCCCLACSLFDHFENCTVFSPSIHLFHTLFGQFAAVAIVNWTHKMNLHKRDGAKWQGSLLVVRRKEKQNVCSPLAILQYFWLPFDFTLLSMRYPKIVRWPFGKKNSSIKYENNNSSSLQWQNREWEGQCYKVMKRSGPFFRCASNLLRCAIHFERFNAKCWC